MARVVTLRRVNSSSVLEVLGLHVDQTYISSSREQILELVGWVERVRGQGPNSGRGKTLDKAWVNSRVEI